MSSFPRMFSSVSAALALVTMGSVLAVPVPDAASLESHATSIPTTPFVLYMDKLSNTGGLPPASQLAGWNVVNLSFLTLDGPKDQVLAFSDLDKATKADKKAEYAAAGISLVVSAFGEKDKPTTSGADPADTATKMAQFVLDQKLDGIDVDYEDLDAMNAGNGLAEAWVTTFTQTLRQKLPQGQFILSHAPIAPWLSPNSQFVAGAYVKVNQNVGSLIDYYNIQFYNQNDLYTDCPGLVTTAGAPFNGSALLEIPTHGFDINKLVLGKPGTTADAATGFIDPTTLGTCVDLAAKGGWKAGIMAFQFPEADAAWIKAAKGTTFQ